MSYREIEEKRHAKAMQEAALADCITAALPELGHEYRVHPYPLHGMVASVKLGDWSLRADPAAPGWDVAHALALALPAEPLTLVKDSCTSIQPSEFVNTVPEEKRDRWKEERELSPYWIEIDPGPCAAVSLHWVTKIEGCGLVRVDFIRSGTHYPEIGRYEMGHAEKRVRDGYVPAMPSRFHPHVELHTLQRDGESLASLEGPIKWWDSGYANRFTLFWVELGGSQSTPADLVAALQENAAAALAAKS